MSASGEVQKSKLVYRAFVLLLVSSLEGVLWSVNFFAFRIRPDS